jgi:hypothetical protein
LAPRADRISGLVGHSNAVKDGDAAGDDRRVGTAGKRHRDRGTHVAVGDEAAPPDRRRSGTRDHAEVS